MELSYQTRENLYMDLEDWLDNGFRFKDQN